MEIRIADPSDLSQILELQYLAYQSEAILLNNYSIPPLLQTIEDIRKENEAGCILKATDASGEIIGSVRGYVKDNTLYIGKLIVHPTHQGKGIGTTLLKAIEQAFPSLRYELFTSNRSIKNLGIYEHLGYQRFRESTVSPDLTFIYLEKNTK